MAEKKQWKDLTGKEKKRGLIALSLIAFVIVVLIGAVSIGGNEKAETIQPKDKQSAIKLESASENDAERYCQDAALLGKYIDLNKVDIIDLGKYNVQYSDAGSYDKQGRPIKILEWTGKTKENDETIRFSCWISGKKDNIQLHRLSMNGTDLYGSASSFESYDKDGKLQQ